MTQSRTLPVPPQHREFTIKVDNQAVPREHQLLSVSICKVANRIASARLCFLDGAASASDFPLSNLDVFIPGKKVQILAGTNSQAQSLFQGIVVRHSLRVRDHSAPQLIVECRHAAMKLTVARKNANFFDQSDSEIIEALLSEAGLQGEVEATARKHPQFVQFHSSDWDLLLARAEANGKLVLTQDDNLVIKAPTLSGKPVCDLQYGATLLELDAEIDARQQYVAVQGVSWDPAQQSLVEVDGQDPSFPAPGNLTASDLATAGGAARLELRHASLAQTEAQAWADATWLRSRLNQVSGRCKCEGIGTVNPGDVVALSGVGKRFNGNVFVTGVRHEFDLVQHWKTHIQFGGVDPESRHSNYQSAPTAGGLLTSVAGLQIGVVVSNEDPDGEHRVRIRLPMVNNLDDGIWARVASLDAGAERGFFFRPEIGDEVVVGFLEGDPRCAVILGMLHSSAKAAPLPGSDANHEKLYQSREGLRLYFNDEKKVLQLDTPAGNRIALSEDAKSIVLADQNGNKIEMNADGITLQSGKALTLKAGTEGKFESGTALSVKGGSELKLTGGSQTELSSGGVTKVAGSIVQIN